MKYENNETDKGGEEDVIFNSIKKKSNMSYYDNN